MGESHGNIFETPHLQYFMKRGFSMLKEIENWSSVRSYKNDDVPEDKLLSVLNAARHAPSWSNVQPWHFVVVKTPETKLKLQSICLGQKAIVNAPVVIVCCGDISAFSIENHKAHIIELIDVGALEVPKEIIEEVLMKNDILVPALRGVTEVKMRVREQVGFAIAFMLLEASFQGLGACVISGLDKGGKEVYDLFSLPENLLPLSLVTLGYYEKKPKNRPRKQLEEIISFEKHCS